MLKRKANIFYSVENAEKTLFTSNKFDLITVAQAIHWFEFDNFYHEAKRTLKPGGVIAVIGYDIFKINKKIDLLIDYFTGILQALTGIRKGNMLTSITSTIPFPFKEISNPGFQ